MFKKVLINVDPSVLDSIPSSFDLDEHLVRLEQERVASFLGLEITSSEGVFEAGVQYKLDYFDWLSDEDLVLIYLRFFLGLSQSSIATIIKGPDNAPYSQSSITYRLKILKRKVELIQKLRKFSFFDVFDTVYKATQSKFLAYMVLLLMRTLNQFHAAKVLGVSQGKVRHLFLTLRDLFKDNESMTELFGLISNWGLIGKCSRFD